MIAKRPIWDLLSTLLGAPLEAALLSAAQPAVGVCGQPVALGFTLTTSYDRITRLEDKIDTRFAQADARFAAQDEEIDARFDSLERDVGEINLKLTALIAALNATDAAIEGRLTGTGAADPADEPR